MKIESAKKLWPIIKAYAEGKTIEVYSEYYGKWIEPPEPDFNEDNEYRIKSKAGIKYAILYTRWTTGRSDYFNGFRNSINDNRIFIKESKSIYIRKTFKVWKKKENAEKMIETIKNTISNPEDYKFSIEEIEE